MHEARVSPIHLPARLVTRDAHWTRLTTKDERALQGPLNLYRFYDSGRRPLYIGQATHLAIRWMGHQSKARWWHLAEYVALSFYPAPQAWIRDIEIAAIQAERPPFNTAGNRRSSRRADLRLAPPPPSFPWH